MLVVFYGIRNHTLCWIGSFLSNRTQTTVVNGVHSSYVEVTSGVPQGSVLGPMLFLLCIDDINNAMTSQIKNFADESVLYRNTYNQNDQVILQNDLDTIGVVVRMSILDTKVAGSNLSINMFSP